MLFSIRRHRPFPVAYFSGFWLLITLLVLSSGQAHAEWVQVGTTDNGVMTVYADPDTIRQKGELVKMWSLYDFKTEQYVLGVLFWSSKAQIEYDCAEERLRGLAVAEFSGNMGKGTVVHTDSSEGKWNPVAPQGVIQALWKAACAKK
jgi:hypothetical protein